MSEPSEGGRAPDAPDTQARLLRVVLDRLPALIAYWDRECHNVVANEAYVEWFGQSPAQILGRHISEVLGPDVYARNLPYIEGVLRGEEQLFERTLVDTLGRTRHTQASYVPDVVDGEVRGFFVLVTDVTPRVEAQRDLAEAQRIASLGSWTLDLATGALDLSAEGRRIAGLGEGPASLERILEIVHPDDLERVRRVQQTAVASGRPYEMDYRLVLPDGEVRQVHSAGHPQRAKDGTVVRLRGIVQDVTTTREREREIARVNAELLQSNQMKSDLIGMLGHDIRQPMQLVVGYLEEALASGAGEAQVRYMERALSGALRTSGMIEDILMMARLDSSPATEHRPATPVRTLVRDVLRDTPGGPEIELGDGDDPCAAVDPMQLRHAVANLVENALRYGAPPYTVEVQGNRDEVTIRVSDTGEGVPAEFVPRLFERFARADSGVALRVSGSGLGLYLVKRLVEATGGTVRYDDNEPQGARFTITLAAAR
jgi:PAS domain S-box-containing protein